jgi:lipopolysaccharide export system permease protein
MCFSLEAVTGMRMTPKLMDRYLIKGFLRPFGACVLIFCILVMLGRFFDKMPTFTQYHARPRDIALFLLYGLPMWLNMVLPVATLLSVLFALGQHQQRGEITALRGAGIATARIYAPYFVVGFILSLFSLAGGLTFLPTINYKARTIYAVNIKHQGIGSYRQDQVVASGRNHRQYTIGWLDVEKSEMKDVVMDRFDNNSRLLETVSARRAVYRDGKWIFYNGKQIMHDPNQPGVFQQTDFLKRSFDVAETPQDFALQDKDPEDMTAKEIQRQIRRQRGLGVPTNRAEVALHMKIALPFAHWVVIALGLPFALGNSHKGKIQTFGYALTVAFIYWGTTSVCQSFGEQGNLPAWMAAWVSNVLFTGVALFLLRKV